MIQTPRGTSDILPSEQKYWAFIERQFEKLVLFFAFSKIDTPMFEYKDVFEKSLGTFTDIVEKQMYQLKRSGQDNIKDEKDKEDLILRPELTASLARAYIEHGMHSLPQPVKLYSIGSVFRYERPQKGRFREHHQLDLEIFGSASSYSDAFLISILSQFYRKIGLSEIIISINSLGCRDCRGSIKKAILDYFLPYKDSLCETCQNRLIKNPLRILDCKEEKCQRIIKNVPPIIDHLCHSCREHFKSVLEYLDDLEISYDFNPRLVRGLDYYTKTVFEIIPKDKGSSLGGGGRYDYLIENLGGRATPAVGAALGMERIIEELKKINFEIEQNNQVEVFLICLGALAKKKSLPLLFKLYNEGFKVAIAMDKATLNSQLRRADKSKAYYSLILGQREARDNTIIVRNMLGGSQETIILKKLPDYLKKQIGGVIKVKKELKEEK